MTSGSGGCERALIHISLDTSGVTSISEGPVACLQRTHSGEVSVKPFQGNTRLLTPFEEERAVTQKTMPLILMLATLWGKGVVQATVCNLTGPQGCS